MGKHRYAITLIGFGEAGNILGGDLAQRDDVEVACFDLKLTDTAHREAMQDKARHLGVMPYADLAKALEHGELIISTVTAASALDAARACAPSLRQGQVFLDCNSVSPGTKRQACHLVEATGADYVDIAIMAPVPPSRLQVPLLMGGRRAAEIAELLNALTMNAQAASTEVGVVSAIKMCRSVMIKGLEALTLECLSAARHYGAEQAVLESLDRSFPGMGWTDNLPDYLISRIAEHGVRRAAEMHEAARTVAEADISPDMSLAVAKTQSSLVEAMHGHGITYEELTPFDWQVLIDRLSVAKACQ